MVPFWSGPCHKLARRANLLAKAATAGGGGGGGGGHMTSGWEVGLSLSQCGHVFVSSLRVTTELIGHLDRGS